MTEFGQTSPVSAAPAPRNGSRRLKVLHVGKFYPPHKGGIETHLRDLCHQLREAVDLRLIVASDDRRASEEVLEGVRVSRISTALTLFSAPICPGMIGKIKSSDADIIHVHWPNPAAVLAYLASGHSGRLIVTYHSDTIRQKVFGAVFRPFLDAALRRSAAIITTSEGYMRASPVLSQYLDRCHIIPLGIDLDEFDRYDPTQVERLRGEYGERVVLSVGRLVYYKGFEYLIRAMTQVRGRLVIIGDGPLRKKLQDLAIQLGLKDRVMLTGEIPGKLAPYYRAADVFALPSIARSEAFGIVQVEAMAAGLPVVNTRIASGVPFVSIDQQTGLTVPPEDSNALASALNRILDNPCLGRTLGRAGWERARKEFSLEAMTRETLALYHTVMKQ